MHKPHFKWIEKLIHFEYLYQPSAPDPVDLALSEEDVISQRGGGSGTSLFLGHYTREEVVKALERTGVISAAGKRGFKDVSVAIDTADPYHHRLLMHAGREGTELLLGEIKVSEGTFTPKTAFIPGTGMTNLEMIIIEWICLQDPSAKFAADKPKLPGQAHPGLGVGKKVSRLLVDMASALGKDGILNFPEYYHNAVFYSLIFLFFNPYMQGRLLAMERDLRQFPVHRVSDAILKGCLVDGRTSAYVQWSPEEQICPVSKRTRAYFESKQYKSIVSGALEENSFTIDWSKYETVLSAEHAKEPGIAP